MVGISGGGGGGGGYNYVQDTEPSAPAEGEEWYDTGANAAFVYDGAAWIEQTVADHSQLTGVGENDHHAKPTGTDTRSESAYPDDWDVSGGDSGGSTVFLQEVPWSDECYWQANHGGTNNCFDVNFRVQYTDGSADTWQKTVCDGNDKTGYRGLAGKPVDYVKAYTDQSGISGQIKIKRYATVPHSHNI